ncbi:zinc ABC transporter ATP-binding protein ZnuC [Rhodovibrionaceae bacterium A322]
MTTAFSPLIDIQQASVQRSGRWLIQGLDLTINPGEIVTLIGPNGSGKSTTAKLVTGVLQPDQGQVKRKAKLKIGYVPQKLNIDWTLPLTVRRLMTLTSKHSKAEVQAALAEVGMAAHADAEVQHLSGGEFQRVLLARAMVRKPDLLVLDEPVQGVDFSGEVALYDLIKEIRNRTGCGILLISHDLHVVMAETDTVVCLNGHVCCRGTPQTVAKSPEYLRLFGNRAAETLAIYQHHHDHTHLPDGRIQNADGSFADSCEGHGHSHDTPAHPDHTHAPHLHGGQRQDQDSEPALPASRPGTVPEQAATDARPVQEGSRHAG